MIPRFRYRSSPTSAAGISLSHSSKTKGSLQNFSGLGIQKMSFSRGLFSRAVVVGSAVCIGKLIRSHVACQKALPFDSKVRTPPITSLSHEQLCGDINNTSIVSISLIWNYRDSQPNIKDHLKLETAWHLWVSVCAERIYTSLKLMFIA